MASEFDELMSAGVSEALDTIGAADLRCGQKVAKVIMAPFVGTREQRTSGMWEEVTTTAEIQRTEFVRLGIVDRAEVTVGGRKLRVMKIDDDLHDPCVRLFLKPA